MSIVEIVANHPEGIGLADLSTRLRLNNSTVFHLIKTLEKLGVVSQSPETKKYRVGSYLFVLAAGALNEGTLLSIATPILERLSRDTGDTAHLAVRSHHEIIVVARTEATGLLQLSGRTGANRPAHATAIGKVLLAEVPEPDIQPLLKTLPLQPFTANTITEVSALLKELDEVRSSGIAVDNCELDDDVKCIAMPVSDFAGRCIAAIGLSGPVWRMTSKRLQKKTRQLRAAAIELSEQLGCKTDKQSLS